MLQMLGRVLHSSTVLPHTASFMKQCSSNRIVLSPQLPRVSASENFGLGRTCARLSTQAPGGFSGPLSVLTCPGYGRPFRQLRSITASAPGEPPRAPEPQGTAAGGGLKTLFAKYGTVAVCTHLAVSLASTAALFVAIRSQVDIPALLEKVGIPRESVDSNVAGMEERLRSMGRWFGMASEGPTQAPSVSIGSPGLGREEVEEGGPLKGKGAMSGAGALALAYLCNKALLPIRTPITLVLTPPLARLFSSKFFSQSIRR